MVLQFNYESTLPNGWVIVPHNLSQREDDVLAIDTVNKAVVWLSQNCLRVIRSYSLHSLPLHATFCAFDAPTHGNPASSSSGSDSDTNRDNHSRLHRGIAILVTHTYLQLHMLSGESYDLQLSVPMQTMVALPRGLLFHAVTSDDDSNGDSTRTANTNGGDTSITIDDINLTMDTIRSSHIHRGNQEKTETLYSLLYPTQSVISVRDSAIIDNAAQERILCIQQNVFCSMTTDKNSGNAIINLYAVSPIVTIESISSASNTLGIFNHNDAFKPTFIDSSADAVDKSSSHPMSIVKGTDDQYSQHLQNSTFPVNLLYDTELHQSTLQSSMNHFSLNSNNISNINDTTIFGIDTSSVHGGRNSMDNSNFPQDPLNPAMFLNVNTVLNTSSILKDPGNVGGNNRKSPVVTSQAELLNDLLGANDTKNTRDEYYPGQRSVSPSYFRAPSLLGNNSLNALGRKSIPGTFTVGGAQQFSHHDPSGVIPNLHAFGANLNNSSMISGVTNRSIGSTSVKQQLKIVRRSSTSIHIPYSDSIKATFSGSFEQLGGFLLHLSDSSTGLYCCFQIDKKVKSKGLQTKSAAALELGLPTIKFEKEYFLTLIMCNNQANSILSASNCSIVDGKFLAIVSVCCDDLQEYFSKHIYSAQQQIVFSNANESFSGHLTVNHNRSDEFYRNRNCISFTFFKKNFSNDCTAAIYQGTQFVANQKVEWEDILEDFEDVTVPIIPNDLLSSYCGKNIYLIIQRKYYCISVRTSLFAMPDLLQIRNLSLTGGDSTLVKIAIQAIIASADNLQVNLVIQVLVCFLLQHGESGPTSIMCALGALFRLDSTILSSLPLATSSSIYQDYDVLKADLIAALNRNRHCHIVSKRVDPIDIVASIHWVLQNEKLSNSLHCNWLAFEPAFGRLLELIVSTVYPELSSSMDIEDNSGATATGSGKFLINIASVYRGKDVVAGDSQVYDINLWMASCINQLNAPTKNFPVGVDLKRPLYSSVISKNLQSNAASQLLELLPTKRAFTVDPYKSLRVAADFFYYLLQNCGYIKRISTAESWAVSIVDAFVYSVVRNHSISINKGKAKVWHSAIIKCGWDGALELFPITLKDLISRAMSLSIDRPNKNWPSDVLTMIGRRDIAANRSRAEGRKIPIVSRQSSNEESLKASDEHKADGLNDLEEQSQWRFSTDNRLHEVCRMLRSSSKLYLKLEKAPEVSEADYRHKLQLKLSYLCRRCFACPVGRGMLTLGTLTPFIAETLPIPVLSLTGRVPPNNSVVTLDTAAAHSDLTIWPDFHNGVAASLRIGFANSVYNDNNSKSHQQGNKQVSVTRNWIIYNRTSSQSTSGAEASHAGFLLGLGLQGHLTALSLSDICDYLTLGNEVTTIAVLIGCAASKIGSADPVMSKTLCLHLPALLPAHHWEIEILPMIQGSALIGLGLLHCRSGNRLMTEFLLSQMFRNPPSDLCDHSEAISLCASWALGLILLGRGKSTSGEQSMAGLHDLQIESRLQQLIDGGKRPKDSRLFPTSANVDANSKSSRILSSDRINTSVTAPGAIFALAMIYMRSNNTEILQKLSFPSTLKALSEIRPDMLLYRAIGRCLVQWDAVTPTKEWLDQQIPLPIKESMESLIVRTFTIGNPYTSLGSMKPVLHQKIALPLYISLLAGYCFGIGLVHAGTSNDQAKELILGKLRILQSLRDGKPIIPITVTIDKMMKPMIEMCTCTIALSLSSVMAGSGDIDCLRILRELRWKVDETTWYGSHLALAMSIGALFLSGGTASFRRDPFSTACLLLAMCPRYPMRTVDNQFHLQVLRHMYVLATENRALHTIDVDSGLPVSVPVEVVSTSGDIRQFVAPGLLPELATIKEIRVSVTNSAIETLDCDIAEDSEKSYDSFYPTSIVLNGNDSSSILRHNNSAVPPLYVKKIVSKQSVPAQGTPIEAVAAVVTSSNRSASSLNSEDGVFSAIGSYQQLLNLVIESMKDQ